jgi:hypothetical protein
VAYPGERASQNSTVPQDIDEQSLPSFPQPAPFPFTLSATPEAIPKIKAKEQKKEGECSKKVEEYPIRSQGISIPVFLELRSYLIQ